MLHELPAGSEMKRLRDDGGGNNNSGILEVWIPSTIFDTWTAGRISPQLLINGCEDGATVRHSLLSSFKHTNHQISLRSRK